MDWNLAVTFDLQSEEFTPTGGIGGDGARRALGRPKLNVLEVLVREAIQNSLDARASPAHTVEFRIDVHRLTAWQRACLLKTVLAERPAPTDDSLARSLDRLELDVIVLSDRGTTGLGGPTRNDRVEDNGAPRNFLEFFRNVGRIHEGTQGGGTYGFGKAILYEASRANTIVVYTRCMEAGKPQSRLMAAALGKRYDRKRSGKIRSYTGRQWWGRQGSDATVEPVTGAEADRYAQRLGFPPFEDGQTGTSILIVDPDLADGSGVPGEDGARHRMGGAMARIAQWYCWPHLLAGRGPVMTLAASVDGTELAIPAVQDDPLLRSYAQAYRTASGGSVRAGASNLAYESIESRRPARQLGGLGLTRVYSNVRPRMSSGEADASDFETVPSGPPCHVAIMRSPKLVVRYISYPVPSDGAGFVGVFVADAAMNDLLAEAEPVTHDRWNADSMGERSGKSLVRLTLRGIDNAVRSYLHIATPSEGEAKAADYSLGRLSRVLGEMVPWMDGNGPETQPLPGASAGSSGRGAGTGRAPRGRRLDIEERPRLSLLDGQTVAIFGVRLRTSGERHPLQVRCDPRVLTADGAREGSPPAGAPVSQVISWDIAGAQPSQTIPGAVVVPPDSDITGTVTVSVPADSCVTVALEACGQGAVR